MEHAIVQTLTASIREMDQPCKYDAATFGVLLPATALADAVEVAERIRSTIEQLQVRVAAGETLRFTASLGVAQAETNDHAAVLIQRAMQAVMVSAGEGGNRVEI